jgi:hypothetical protein
VSLATVARWLQKIGGHNEMDACLPDAVRFQRRASDQITYTLEFMIAEIRQFGGR